MKSSARKLVLPAAMALAMALPINAQAAGAPFEHILFISGLNSPYALSSQDFTDDTRDTQIADDFTVPAGQSWHLAQVDVAGTVSGNPPSAVNVSLFANAGSVPGAELFHENGIAASFQPNYSARLRGAPDLEPGTYWISVVEAGGDSAMAWRWYTIESRSGNPGVFRAPDGGSESTCTDWTPISTCFSGVPPDMSFRLIGTARSQLLSLGKLTRLRNGTARLAVTASGPGAVVLSGKGVIHRARFVTGPSTAIVRIKSTGRARKILDARGKVTVNAKLAFQATGAGQWTPQARKVKLRKR
jgi:hypothetical protein